MKKQILASFVIIAAVVLVACKKDNSVSSGALQASKSSSIRLGEPVLFSFPSSNASATVNWSVSPSTNTQINANGNQASILFGRKGNYIVSATDGSSSASREVSVQDSIYTGGGNGNGNGGGLPNDTIRVFASGETIHVGLSRIDSGANSGLIFYAVTSQAYSCQSNYLLGYQSSASNSLSLNYSGYVIPGGCTTGTNKPATGNNLFPINAGVLNLSIQFKGTTYTGTITKTGNSYSVSWPYSSGVVLSPLSL